MEAFLKNTRENKKKLLGTMRDIKRVLKALLAYLDASNITQDSEMRHDIKQLWGTISFRAPELMGMCWDSLCKIMAKYYPDNEIICKILQDNKEYEKYENSLSADWNATLGAL